MIHRAARGFHRTRSIPGKTLSRRGRGVRRFGRAQARVDRRRSPAVSGRRARAVGERRLHRRRRSRGRGGSPRGGRRPRPRRRAPRRATPGPRRVRGRDGARRLQAGRQSCSSRHATRTTTGGGSRPAGRAVSSRSRSSPRRRSPPCSSDGVERRHGFAEPRRDPRPCAALLPAVARRPRGRAGSACTSTSRAHASRPTSRSRGPWRRRRSSCWSGRAGGERVAARRGGVRPSGRGPRVGELARAVDARLPARGVVGGAPRSARRSTFPEGRPWSRLARIAIPAAYALTLGGQLVGGLVAPDTRDLLSVTSHPSVAHAIDRAQEIAGVGVALGVLVLVLQRLHASGPPGTTRAGTASSSRRQSRRSPVSCGWAG